MKRIYKEVDMTRDERQKKYDDKNCMRISLKLNYNTDADIIEKVDINNKQASIKKLIRKGIEG